MLLWVVLAVLTVATVIALARPLATAAAGETSPTDRPDVQIYKDQLAEIETDRQRGVLSDAEAASARIEISRRLLASAERAEVAEGAVVASRRGPLQTAVAAGVPLIALLTYLALGSPHLPGRPHAERPPEGRDASTIADPRIEELVARVEQRLRAHPEEGQGWDVIAPVYMRQERYLDAAIAYKNAIRLLGETPVRLTGLGEALVMSSQGLVTEEARRTFTRLRELAPGGFEARFWLALAKEQDGDVTAALTDYRAILSSAPAEAGWRPMVEQRIEQLTRQPGAPASPPSAKGPTNEAAAAMAALPPAEQGAMIRQMVEGLAERLRQNGRDSDGWQRLVRSYVVLGRRDDAVKALADARTALDGDRDAVAALDKLAISLGL